MMAARNYHKGASQMHAVRIQMCASTLVKRLGEWLAICQEYYGIRLIVRN